MQLELGRDIPADADGYLVEVLGCTICGSDLHSCSGRRQVETPSVLGHEIVGRLVGFAKNEERVDIAGQPLKIGDRVTWCLVANCGSCFYCDKGLPQKCLDGVKYGHSRVSPGDPVNGGFASHVLLDRRTKFVKLPEAMTIEEACPLNCAVATSAAAMDFVPPQQELSVSIHGMGMIGLTLAAMCRSQGATNVIAVDPSPLRLKKSQEFGATAVVPPDDFWTQVKQLTQGHGVDVAFECSGNNAAWESAFQNVRLGGSLVLVGAVFPGNPVELPMERIVRRNLQIHGVHNYAPQHLEEAVRFVDENRGRFDFHSLVDRWFSLGDIEQAIAAAKDQGSVRVGVGPERSASDA